MLCQPNNDNEDNEEKDVGRSNIGSAPTKIGKAKARSGANDAVVSEESLNKKKKRSNDSVPSDSQPGGLEVMKASSSLGGGVPSRSGKSSVARLKAISK
jgi:hypothetical protein